MKITTVKLSLDNKEIDPKSIMIANIDPNEYPGFASAYIGYAEFNDGTPLEDNELDKLNEAHGDEVVDELLADDDVPVVAGNVDESSEDSDEEE